MKRGEQGLSEGEASGSRPLRIITVCYSGTAGGLELATLRRGAELRAAGHQVVAVLPDSPPLADYARQLSLPVETIDPMLPYLDPQGALRLRLLARRLRADVVLVGRTRDLSTAMLALGDDVAVVLYQQMQSGIRKRDLFHDWLYRRLDGCIAITRHGRDQLLECTSIEPEKISVIPYGIDTGWFSQESVDRSLARAGFSLPEEAFCVGIIGGFDPAKGQREFLQGLRMVAEQDPEIGSRLHALLIGERQADDPGYIDELRKLRDSLPFADRVQFHGFRSDPRSGFAALDLFVLASHSETFGMVVQEGLAMGVPIIATSSPGVAEIIVDGETGLLVPPRSPEAIARAIISLYHDSSLRERMARNGRLHAMEAYDSQRQYIAFERALYQAVARRRSS
jgi:glycosyltransferase involved in cell wall biosynthesis